ncbi:SRPBCC family protein [Mycobacterium sp. IDR2000157661]|uniref:SRPBCC family protein n=1 Tax=Mycobacterium sp. IDR2000157661 TaxID=2867005 RepID=UPI001EEC3EB6|nr:SRPBCC family protein [Mycobacterium sp. IDR2000157661]ULE33994.1 SRPBCC family protein [Mycobacterium sp. IDR2000157661]
MAAIDRTRKIAATAAQIWDILADFGALSGWVDGVDHSCILTGDPATVGTTRRVQVGRNVLVERISEFDPQVALGYDIEGLPKLLGKVGNRWSLAPTSGDRTLVTITSTVDVGPRLDQQLAERVACRVLARQSDGMLAGLADRLENANV